MNESVGYRKSRNHRCVSPRLHLPGHRHDAGARWNAEEALGFDALLDGEGVRVIRGQAKLDGASACPDGNGDVGR